MKKLFILFLALVASIETMFAWDYERVQIGDLYYNLDATNLTAEVTWQNHLDIDNYSGLIEIAIPASVTYNEEYNEATYSVTSIGEDAFGRCPSLTSIDIPQTVAAIGEGALYYCPALTMINVDNENQHFCSVDGLLFNKDMTTLIQFPPAKSVTSYTIPNSVSVISYGAFGGCSSLESIIIPNSVTTIEKDALRSCSSLSYINIPASVTSIGEYFVNQSSQLTDILVNSDNQNYCSENGVLFSKDMKMIIRYPEGKEGASYTIPSGVTTMEACAFGFCSHLENIVIPEGVTNISDGAFHTCSSLHSISIPSTITEIGDLAFYECPALSDVHAPNLEGWLGVPIIYTYSDPLWFAHNLYFGDELVENLVIPATITKLRRYAFRNCTCLKSITCEAVTPPALDGSVFWNVDKSIPLYIPCEAIEAYKEADGWKEFTNIQAIPGQAPCVEPCNPASGICGAQGDNLTWELSCNGVLTVSGTGAMADREYDSGLWYEYRENIASVVIEEGVTSIGDKAFADCQNLIAITIPNTVTSIGEAAFYHCLSLGDINVPRSVNLIKRGAFRHCPEINISVDADNQYYTIENGVLFNKEKTLLHTYPMSKHEATYSIPNTVTDIEDLAFYYADITSIDIPEGVHSIGVMSFYVCNKLTSITIPNSVTTIGDGAFYSAQQAKFLHLGQGLTSIGQMAFGDMRVIEYIISEAQIPPVLLNNDVFEYVDKSIPLYVPCEAIDAYKDAEGWNEFTNVQPIPGQAPCVEPCVPVSGTCGAQGDNLTWELSCDGVLNISGTGAMADFAKDAAPWNANRDAINSVSIENGVTSIGRFAFYECVNMASVAIPEGVTSIGDSAFSECAGITSITIPANVERTGNSVFNACTSLKEVTMLPETAPAFGSYIFSNITSNFPIYVPCGTIDAYKSALSYYASKIQYAPLEYSVTGLVNDPVAGSVTVPTNSCENTFTAVANEGYEFKQWSDGETVNPREVILTKDTTLTAVFEQIVTGTIVIHDGESKDLSELDPAGTQSIEEIIVEPGGELNVDDANIHIGNLVIVTDGTNSGQVHHGAEGINADHIYLEYILNPCGEFASSNRWYAISVPFEVDIATGISRTCDDKTLVSGTDFLIKEYNGTLRALLGHGWSDRVDGSLNAGQFYMIGIDGTCNRWRFEQKAGQPFEGDTHVGYDEYASSNPLDKGWNGLGNTMLEYMRMNMGASGINYMVTYDNCYGRFVTRLIADIHLCVGRPFFIQASSDGFFDFFFGNTLNNMPALRAPAQAVTPLMHFTLADETQSTGIDHMYLTLHEDAQPTYTIGRDVARMTTNCTTAAQLWCTMSDGTELSAHGIEFPETETIVPLTLFAPKDSEYLVNMSSRAMNGYQVELLQNGTWTATLFDGEPVTLELSAGTNSDYSLRITRRNIPTGLEDVQGDNVQSTKVIMNDHLYILRAGLMYDAQGKKVK